jgi:hypothetical protein
MARAWRSGETAGTAIPNGADLILRGVEGALPEAEPAIRYHDEAIARGVLAHFLNLGTQTGSWALGSTFADFFTLSLQTVAQQIADTATCHVVEDLVDANWGPDEPAPKICFDEIGSRPDAAALSSLSPPARSSPTTRAGRRCARCMATPAKPTPVALPRRPAPPHRKPPPRPGLRPPAPSPRPHLSMWLRLVDGEWQPVQDFADATARGRFRRAAQGTRYAAAAGQLRQLKGTTRGGQFAKTLAAGYSRPGTLAGRRQEAAGRLRPGALRR